MRWRLAVLVFISMACEAQTYKCVDKGKSVYSDRPCSESAVKLNIGDSADETERLRQAARKRDEAGEAMVAAVEKGQRRARSEDPDRTEQRQYVPATTAQAPSKRDYCNNLLRLAKEAKDESNKWRYHQGLIDDAKRRQKEAEDAHFSECYGSNF